MRKGNQTFGIMSVNNKFRRSQSVDNSCGLTSKLNRRPY